MLTELKEVITRSRAMLIEDMAGVLTLFGLLVLGLHLSGAA
jgi:hypothetical protein